MTIETEDDVVALKRIGKIVSYVLHEMLEAAEPGSAFVPWVGGPLAEILCHQEDRVVGKDNTVVFGRLRLQIEPSPLRAHFVKATVQLRRYADNTIAIFYGPRCIGRYAADGAPLDIKFIAA